MRCNKLTCRLEDGTLINLSGEARKRGLPISTVHFRYRNSNVPNTLEALFAPSMPTGKAAEVVWCGRTLNEWCEFLRKHNVAITRAGVSSYYHQGKRKWGQRETLRRFLRARGIEHVFEEAAQV